MQCFSKGVSDTVHFCLTHKHFYCLYLTLNADCSSAAHTHTWHYIQQEFLHFLHGLPPLPSLSGSYADTASDCLSLVSVYSVSAAFAVSPPLPTVCLHCRAPDPINSLPSCSSLEISPSICRGLLTARLRYVSVQALLSLPVCLLQ